MWALALSLAVAFILNRWLIPAHGSIGAALAVVISESVFGAVIGCGETLMLNVPEHAHEDESILTAADLLAQRWRTGHAPKVLPPHTVIICYQRAAITALLKRYRHTKVDGFFGEFHRA